MIVVFCWCSRMSHIKVKGHLRSNIKIAWNCEIWSHLKSWNPIWTIIMSHIWYQILHMIMIKLDDLRPIFIDLAMSFKILGSTTSCPIFCNIFCNIARPISFGWTYPIVYTLGQRCKIRTFTCWQAQMSHIKVKGHQKN